MDKISDAEVYAEEVIEFLHETVLKYNLDEKDYLMLIEVVSIKLEDPIPFDDIMDF